MKLGNPQSNFSTPVSTLHCEYNSNLMNRMIIAFSEFQILFSKENETTESPRIREFRKKLRERTPIGILGRNIY